jgi:tRNA(fMet)-specific endonuclease VapC
MQYLLDTNACVAYLRSRNALLTQRFRARSAADLHLCSVVKAELLRGILRSSRPAAERARVGAFMQPYLSLVFDDAAAAGFARLRFHLESLGTPIGPYDMQIASIALVHHLTVVTHNTSEFSRVPGLAIEDWEVP